MSNFKCRIGILSARSVFIPVGAAAVCLLLCAGTYARASESPALADAFILTVNVVDTATGGALPARCSVTDQYGIHRYPPPGTSFYHSAEEGYFYCSGQYSVIVSEGNVTVRTGYGFEYRADVRSIEVSADTAVVVGLGRICDMRAAGWYPGDPHTHLNHGYGYYTLDPCEALFMATAEDLAVINCLDNEYFFTGGPDPCSSPDCIVYMSEEKRSGVYGHYGLLGLSALLQPTSENWGGILAGFADAAHSQDGAIVIAAHPVSSEDFDQIIDWPGSGIARELPVDMIYGKVDAIEIMSYSNHGWGVQTGLWYDLLNCGFRIPCCGGTDALLNQLGQYPAGGFRTYVNVGAGEFDYRAWLDGIRRGRTFATNGPLFSRFAVLGFGAGDTLFVYRGEYKIPVEVTVECAYPMERVEILRNGGCVKTIYPTTDPCRIDTLVNIRVSESSWIAARALGRNGNWFTTGDSLFAHTSPFYFNMEHVRINERFAAERLADWIDAVIGILADREDWPSAGDSLSTSAFFRAGKEYYETLAGKACDTGEFKPVESGSASLLLRASPNPFSSVTFIRLEGGKETCDAGAGRLPIPFPREGRIAIYDVAGRIVRSLFDGAIEDRGPGLYWDGRDDAGREAPSGVYFVRLRSGDQAAGGKVILIR